MMSANAASLLMQHYVDKYRRLPWRAAPGGPRQDPYFVWLSEVMLQQTTVAAVTPRFERFVRRWPDVASLAAASDEDILSEWAGLGYYARARNLIACARKVAELGGFPDEEEELRKLPGIGDYTAAAIAAIAFGRRAIVVDTNVARVVARLHALEAPSGRQVRELANALTPEAGAGDFAQAMMDLGATICRPRAPLCEQCPLGAMCAANLSGDPERFPAKKAKGARPVRYGLAHWIERDGHIWLVRRPSRGMLGGMAALPGPEWSDSPQECAVPPIAEVIHGFTHFTLRMQIHATRNAEGEGWWQPIAAIADSGLPTLYRKAVEAVLATSERRHAA